MHEFLREPNPPNMAKNFFFFFFWKAYQAPAGRWDGRSKGLLEVECTARGAAVQNLSPAKIQGRRSPGRGHRGDVDRKTLMAPADRSRSTGTQHRRGEPARCSPTQRRTRQSKTTIAVPHSATWGSCLLTDNVYRPPGKIKRVPAVDIQANVASLPAVSRGAWIPTPSSPSPSG